jgi:hypothetical protein
MNSLDLDVLVQVSKAKGVTSVMHQVPEEVTSMENCPKIRACDVRLP